MARLIGTGTLAGTSQSDDIDFEDFSGGLLGIKLTGNFDGGTIELLSGDVSSSSYERVRIIDPVDASKSFLVWAAEGFYHWIGVADGIRLSLVGASGSASVLYRVYMSRGNAYTAGHDGSVA